MVNFLLSPVGGFFLTLCFFIASLFIVLGAKSANEFIKLRLPKKKVSAPPQNEQKPKTTRPKKKPSAVRSIEINPDEIDRIYVKKIS
ncbi:MAG: hypothetical protein IJV95_03935 [Clostridia bacterium]|nr:hypothetical protein [Clostridia bacterium]